MRALEGGTSWAQNIKFSDGEVIPLADYWGDFISTSQGGYTRFPNLLMRGATKLGLDPHSLLVLLYLMSWMLSTDPERPLRIGKEIRLSNIQEGTGLSRNHVMAGIARLDDLRLIDIEHTRGGSNVYTLLVHNLIDALADFQGGL